MSETYAGPERVCRFSPCRRYRYTLWRQWDSFPLALEWDAEKFKSYLMVIGLNPSTADETKDDPTIRKCVGFAKRWGYGALCMTNLFAWRATKPEDMIREQFPVGEDNQHHILACAAGAGMILAAWGKHGSFRAQGLTTRQWLGSVGEKLHCLKRNKDGSPMHPLYVPYETTPILFT